MNHSMGDNAAGIGPRGVLHLVISGAPAPEGLPALVRLCQADGWQVVVFSTPAGLGFTDVGVLQALTGSPVRSQHREPGTPRMPQADAVLACPLTFTSVNKFAQGIADSMALGLLCEAAGYGVSVTVVPHCKPQLASHPAFRSSIEVLRGMGVQVLFDPSAPYDHRMPSWTAVAAALPITEGARRG
jgi:phosphopantothenoylcysteine synthetase/decarboxylase